MSPIEQEEDLDCDICGESHKCKYVHTLKCNHSFHYECIMKSYVSSREKYNQCPLCRTKQGLLPLVNGLPKLIRGIHYTTPNPPPNTSTRCKVLLKSGKRKGFECGSKCILGFDIMGIWKPNSSGDDINAISINNNINIVYTGDDYGNLNCYNYPCVVKGAPGQICSGHSSHVMNVQCLSNNNNNITITVGGNDNTVIGWKTTKYNNNNNNNNQHNNQLR